MKIMKTFAKLSLLALAGFSLVACGLNRPGPDGRNNKSSNKGWGGNARSEAEYVPPAPKSSEDDGYVEPTSEEEDFPTYRLPGEKEQPEEEPNVLPFEWEGFVPADPVISIPEPGAADPVQATAEAVYLLLWGVEGAQYTIEYGYESGLLADKGDGSYVTYASWGAGSAGDTELLHEYYTPDFIPDGFAMYYDQGATAVTGTDECYVAYYANSDVSILIQEMIYILTSSGTLYSQYKIAAADYFMA